MALARQCLPVSVSSFEMSSPYTMMRALSRKMKRKKTIKVNHFASCHHSFYQSEIFYHFKHNRVNNKSQNRSARDRREILMHCTHLVGHGMGCAGGGEVWCAKCSNGWNRMILLCLFGSRRHCEVYYSKCARIEWFIVIFAHTLNEIKFLLCILERPDHGNKVRLWRLTCFRRSDDGMCINEIGLFCLSFHAQLVLDIFSGMIAHAYRLINGWAIDNHKILRKINDPIDLWPPRNSNTNNNYCQMNVKANIRRILLRAHDCW